MSGAERVPCPVCEAPIGARCTSIWNRPRSYEHRRRVELYWAMSDDACAIAAAVVLAVGDDDPLLTDTDRRIGTAGVQLARASANLRRAAHG